MTTTQGLTALLKTPILNFLYRHHGSPHPRSLTRHPSPVGTSTVGAGEIQNDMICLLLSNGQRNLKCRLIYDHW
jgi:hypothetical protein